MAEPPDKRTARGGSGIGTDVDGAPASERRSTRSTKGTRGQGPSLTPAQQREQGRRLAAALEEAEKKAKAEKRQRPGVDNDDAEEDPIKAVKEAGGKTPPAKAAYTGFGLLGTLGVMQVTNEQVEEQLGDAPVETRIIRALMDSGINGAQPEWLTEHDGKAKGLCQALAETVDDHALQWMWAKEKICDVVHVALQRASEALKRGGPEAAELFKALGHIFKSEKDQRTLEHLLSQLGSMLNDWADSRPDAHEGSEWMTTWRPFTLLLEHAARDIKVRLPTTADQLSFLVNTEEMSDDAKRLYHFAVQDICAGRGQLTTALSPAFLNAQVPSLQTAINNLLDTEHGKGMRGLVRVVTELLAVEKISLQDGNEVHLAQAMSRKVLNALVLDMASDYFYTGDSGNGIGWVWRPDVADGIGLFKAGFISRIHEEDEAQLARPLRAPRNDVSVEELFSNLSAGDRVAAPSILLRGISETAETFQQLCDAVPRVLVMTVASEDVDTVAQVLDPRLSQSSEAGQYLRRLLQPIWKHLRKAAVVCSTPEWTKWWTHQLEQGGVKKFHHLELVSDLAGGLGRVPDAQYMLQLDSDQEKAQAVKLWFDKVSELCGGRLETENGHDEDAQGPDEEEEESDAAVEKKRTKFTMTLRQFYRATGKPTYPLVVDEDVLDRLEGVAEEPISDETVENLTRPFVAASADAPDGFHVFSQLLTTHPEEGKFVEQFKLFLDSEKTPGWSDVAAAGIGNATSNAEVAAALLGVKDAPWSLSRSAASVARGEEARVTFNIGQVAPKYDGNDFLSTPEGSSKVVRLAMRAGEVRDNLCCCVEALPINVDLDAMVRCEGCKERLRALIAQLPRPPPPAAAAPVVPVAPVVAAPAPAPPPAPICHHVPVAAPVPVPPVAAPAPAAAPAAVPAPAAAMHCQCKQRHETIMEWLRLHFLANLKMASLANREVMLVPWGQDARKVLSLALDPARPSHEWVKELHLREPDAEFSHPNAPAFSFDETQIAKHLKSVAGVVKWVSRGAFRSVKEFKAHVKATHSVYDSQRLQRKLMDALSLVRPILARILQRICRAVNWMRGAVDAHDNSKGSLDVVDLRWRVNRLLLSLHLQHESVAPDFVAKVAALPKDFSAVKPRQDSAHAGNKAMPVHTGKLSKRARKDFLRRCYQTALNAAGQRNLERFSLLERLEVDQQERQWKKKLAMSFQRAVREVLKSVSQETALKLSKVPPKDLLDIALPSDDDNPGHLMLPLEQLEHLEPATTREAPLKIAEKARRQFFLKPAEGWRFVPKQPQVKLVPNVGYTIGHILISREVGVELLVRAMRCVVDDHNLLLLGGIERDTAVRVISAAVDVSFRHQRDHFRKGGVEGGKAGLLSALTKAFEGTWSDNGTAFVYSVLPQTIAGEKTMSKALMLSLFDWKRVVHPRHQGKLIASSDGVGLNLLALPKKKQRSGFGGVQWSSDKLGPCNPAFKSVGGIDYGKSGAVAMMPPQVVQVLMQQKAAAEASMVRLEEEKSTLTKVVESAQRELEAVEQELEKRNGCWIRSLENRNLKAQWQLEEANERLRQIDADIAGANQRVLEATLLEEDARKLLASNKHKGVQCVTKAQKALELNEKRLRDERERRLAIFAECLRGNDTTHHTLQASVKSLPGAAAAQVIDVVASRLRTFRPLQIAHNSGQTRQQRRTTDKLKRAYVARFTRAVTKVLPEAVAKAGDKFLERNVEFPPRSPHSRMREQVRGWERGTHVALERIAHANATNAAPPLGPLHLSCDMFSTKGQRVTSTYFFASLHRSMCRLIKSSPLAKRITVLIENGYRSSRQAAGLLSYLANMDRCNHRKVKATDVQWAWQGPLVGSFKWFYCPVTRKLVKRDPPAALSMCVIGTCSLHGAPRFNNFCPDTG
jgi:hypothetical protein